MSIGNLLKDLSSLTDIGLWNINLELRLQDKIFPASLVISDHSSKYVSRNIDQLVSKDDKVISESLPTKERKRSFLLGRITAIKSVTNVDKSLDPKDITIKWGVFNQPIVICNSFKNIKVSISHSHNIAASLAFDESCPMTIDIEKICPTRAKSVVSQLSEFETVNLIKNDVDLITLWTIKESLSKRLETGLLVDFALYEVSQMVKKEGYAESYFKNFPQYKVFSYLINGYIYSILLPRDVEIYLR